MKIAIDCRWITTDTGGIRNYTLNLVKNLLTVDKENEYFLIYDKEETKEVILEYIEQRRDCFVRLRRTRNDKLNFINVKYGPFSFKSQILLAFVLNNRKIDILHSTNFMIPIFFNRYKIIITVHDLIPYLFPQWCYRSKKAKVYPVYKKITEIILNKVDSIISDSQNTKKDIEKVFPECASKVDVVYLGVETEKFRKVDSLELVKALKKKLNLPEKGKILLYVGRQDPSKNLIGIIKAFNIVQSKNKDINLVIAGKKDTRYKEPYELVEKLNLNNSVFFTGLLSNEDLVLLFNAADIFVFLSFYEGFGLPPLEAMACGLPVIVANTSSLPEVVGDAAIKVDPGNIEEIAWNIIELLGNSQLQETLRKKGFEQVRKFSWEKAAEETLKIYGKIGTEEIST